MAFNKRPAEIGWFYHTSNKTNTAEMIPLPPTSQVPGLSDLPPEPPQEKPARGWVRDTDSDYVRLAKNGGRRDLLSFRDPKPRADKAKNYPRVDWFYLEDNAVEDAEKKKDQENENFQYLLPEYMVHHGCTDDQHNKYSPKRAPFQFDNMSAYQREPVGSVTDKTVKLPEIPMYGYGVRDTKLKNKPARYPKQPKPEMAKAPSQEMASPRKFHPVPKDDEQEKPMMSKILSFGYAKDWEVSRDKWAEQQRHLETKENNNHPGPQEKLETEYQHEINNRQAAKGVNSPRNRSHNPSHSYKMHEASHSKIDESPKPEPFILSRFKNVPARTDTHRMRVPVGKGAV